MATRLTKETHAKARLYDFIDTVNWLLHLEGGDLEMVRRLVRPIAQRLAERLAVHLDAAKASADRAVPRRKKARG
jgi:hypothetical protein